MGMDREFFGNSAEDNHNTLLKKYNDLLDRHNDAVEIIEEFGDIDRDHHKMWVIDQVVRKLLGTAYVNWVKSYEEEDEFGEKQYEWDTGIAP